jgi:hypothetical protein
MITSAMRLNDSDLDSIGRSKARTYKRNGNCVAVFENGVVAIVQGYRVNSSIADCLPTSIKTRDLAGLAKACYGQYPDA